MPEIDLPAPPFAAPEWPEPQPRIVESPATTVLRERMYAEPDTPVREFDTDAVLAPQFEITAMALPPTTDDSTLSLPEFPSASPPIETIESPSSDRRLRDRRFVSRGTPDRRAATPTDFNALTQDLDTSYSPATSSAHHPDVSYPAAGTLMMSAPAAPTAPTTPAAPAVPAVPHHDAALPFPDLIPQRSSEPQVPETTPAPIADHPFGGGLPAQVTAAMQSPEAWYPALRMGPPPVTVVPTMPQAAAAPAASTVPVSVERSEVVTPAQRPGRFERIMWMLVVPASAGVGIAYLATMLMH